MKKVISGNNIESLIRRFETELRELEGYTNDEGNYILDKNYTIVLEFIEE